MKNAAIVTIGDELLIGQVIDTNSAFIAQQLNAIGIEIHSRIAIADDEKQITETLDELIPKVDLIIFTGGLGPTNDDITKIVLCNYFDGKLECNSDALSHIEHLYKNIFKRELSEVNRNQALLPTTAKYLPNLVGTAPGMLFEKNGTYIISLPGVPVEMRSLVENSVIPFAKTKIENQFIIHETLVVIGLPESLIAEKLVDVENKLPDDIHLAYLPNFSLVRLRLTGKSVDKNDLQTRILDFKNQIKNILAENVVAEKDQTVQQILLEKLIDLNLSLSTAESCTGGNIAHQITELPGSSKSFLGSVVSYANEVKNHVLGVKLETLEKFGAVSEEVVLEMVRGVLNVTKTDVAIATSGIMGPDGGTEEKPVGTIWIAVGNKEKQFAQKYFLRFDRLKNIEIASMIAMNQLRKFIVEHY